MSNPLENNAFIDASRTESYPSTVLANFSNISTFQLFSTLTFWNKLEFLKHTVDKVVLQDIQQNTTSKQLRALSMFRLYQLD